MHCLGGFQQGLNYQRLEEDCWQSTLSVEFRDRTRYKAGTGGGLLTVYTLCKVQLQVRQQEFTKQKSEQ